jgi:OOP family OmpA-OmpF porin
MKTIKPIVAAALAASFLALGCSGSAQVAVNEPPPPPPEPKKEEPPPPPPAPAPAPAPPPQLVGLPLTGSQIDVLGEIQYDTSSATIKQTPQNIGLLTTLATAGKAYPMITKLRVEGHTDSDGDDAMNQELSERRAQSVVDWLVANGIDRNRLAAVGCGERDPIASNATEEGKQRNRRTEFDIEDIGGQRWDMATTPCAPNPQRKGYVAVVDPAHTDGAGGVPGSGGSFGLDKTSYKAAEKITIRYSQPMVAPDGQQYWVTLTKAGDSDSTYGTWHYVKPGATTDEIVVPSGASGEHEVRLHDLYPRHPHKVISRQRVTIR